MWSVWLVFCDCDFHSVCPLMWRAQASPGLWKLPDGRDWLWGNLGLVLMGGVNLNQIFCWVPSLLFGLRPNSGRSNDNNDDLLQKGLNPHCCFQCPALQQATEDSRLCWRLLDTHRQVWLSLCGDTTPFSWLLVHTGLFLCPPSVCSPSPVEVL